MKVPTGWSLPGLCLAAALLTASVPARAAQDDPEPPAAAERADPPGEPERGPPEIDLFPPLSFEQRSESDRTMDEALRVTREVDARDAAERSRREIDETRREGGLDQGLPIADGYRFSGRVDPEEPRVEVSVSREWDWPQ